MSPHHRCRIFNGEVALLCDAFSKKEPSVFLACDGLSETFPMAWFSNGSVQREREDSRNIATAAGMVCGLHYDVASKEILPATGRIYTTIAYYCRVFQG